MASRPTTIPQLDTSKTNRVAPTAGKIASGYVLGDLFPASNANYLHGWAGDWHEWLQERSEDGATPGTDLTLRGLDALTATGDGGVLTLKGGDGGSTSGDGGNILLLPGSVVSGTPGYVGVGTTAPSSLVEIEGSSPTLTIDAVSGGGTLMFYENGAERWSIVQGTTNKLYFEWVGSRKITIDGTGGSGFVGFGTETPDSLIHAYKGSAGTVTAVTGTIITVEDDSDAFISILTPDAQARGIYLGEASDNDAGGIIYNDAATPDGFQFRVNGNQTKLHIRSSGTVQVVDSLGINESTPLGKCHIKTADIVAGITPSTLADELILENDGPAGLSIFSAGGTNWGLIYFGDASNNARGVIWADHGTNDLYMTMDNAASGGGLQIDGANGKTCIGPDLGSPIGTLHVSTVHTATAVSTDADDLVVTNTSANVGISMLSTATGHCNIHMGDVADTDQAWIQYDCNDLEMTIGVNTKSIMWLEGGTTYARGGIGNFTTAPNATFEVRTHSSVTEEAMRITQSAATYPLVFFGGTSGGDTSATISTLTTPGALQGFLQCTIGGAKRWIPFYADPS